MTRFIFTIGIANLWLILVPSFLLIMLIMRLATVLRGTPILNREDHQKSTIMAFFLGFLIFLALTLVTPIINGPLLWIGLVLIIPAAVFYLCSIFSFLKKREGLNNQGIYAVSRNPMYVAMLLFLAAFSLMAMQVSITWALPYVLLDILFYFLIRRRVKDEETYLAHAYGRDYEEYRQKVPRYVGFKMRGARGG